MREIWRKKGSPQTNEQKDYVKRLCKNFFIQADSPLCLNSNIKVVIDNQKFNSALEAINKLIHLNNESIENILEKVIIQRFEQHEFLRKILLDTGIRYIQFHENSENIDLLRKILSKYRFKLFL